MTFPIVVGNLAEEVVWELTPLQGDDEVVPRQILDVSAWFDLVPGGHGLRINTKRMIQGLSYELSLVLNLAFLYGMSVPAIRVSGEVAANGALQPVAKTEIKALLDGPEYLATPEGGWADEEEKWHWVELQPKS